MIYLFMGYIFIVWFSMSMNSESQRVLVYHLVYFQSMLESENERGRNIFLNALG